MIFLFPANPKPVCTLTLHKVCIQICKNLSPVHQCRQGLKDMICFASSHFYKQALEEIQVYFILLIHTAKEQGRRSKTCPTVRIRALSGKRLVLMSMMLEDLVTTKVYMSLHEIKNSSFKGSPVKD